VDADDAVDGESAVHRLFGNHRPGWTALDADTKLIASWLVGSRDAGSVYEFMQDVASRLRGRVQLTTHGHRPYLEAVEAAFGMDIDFAVLVNLYGAEAGSETRSASRVHRLQDADGDGRSRPEAHLHVLR
jgi:hypothetical protein